MFRKTVSGILLFLLLVSMLTAAFNIKPAKAEGGTIYIRADGSVDPSTAPVLNVGNVYYKLGTNIYDSIVVERDNIVFDGAGNAVQGSTGSGTGVKLYYTFNVTVRNFIIMNFQEGISVDHGSWNSITNNTCSNNSVYGVILRSSGGNKVVNNTILNGGNGIGLGYSNSDIVTNNTLSNNEVGIVVAYSDLAVIRDNKLSSRTIGIELIGSRNVVVVDNSFENCGIWIGGGLESEYLAVYNTHTIEGNSVNGKSIYYYKDASGIRVPEDVGEVIFANCNNVTVENIEVSGGSVGIELAFTTNSTISSSTIFNNRLYGIDLEYSDGNIIKNNHISNNKWGIFLRFSSGNSIAWNTASNNQIGIDSVYSGNNKIYHNNFVNNTGQVSNYYSVNVWDDGYPSGGNYWNDYTDFDQYSGPNQDQPGSDGIWDHPYVIDENNKDRYPLVNPWTPTHIWPMFHHDPAHSGFTFSPAPVTNDTLWVFNTGERVTTSPAVADGKVFVGSMNNIIYALDQFSGGLFWSTQLDSQIFFGSPAIDQGRLFITAGNYTYALSIETGKILWKTYIGLAEFSSPNVAEGMVFVGGYEGLFALDSQTGEVIWHYPIRIASSVAIADGMVFASSFWDAGHVVALNQSDGTLVWSQGLVGMEGGSFVGSPAVSGGKLFVPVIGDHLADPAYGYAYVYAFDEFTGNILWQSIKMGSLYSTPAVAYGKAFIGSYDGNIYAFNESDGSLLWSYVTGDRIETSSPAVASGMVFVGSDDGYVYAFDQKNGEVIWRYKTGHWVCSSPAIVDGIVYVGSLDGNVYAIGSAPTPPVQEWLFDGDFQYNLDNNYGTVEGTGHLSGKAALSAGSLSIGGQITINGPLPTTVPEVYLIATDGPDKELAKQAVDLSGFSYWQTGTNTYNFTGQIPNVIQPINNGHYEAQALITYNTAKYEFFVNTASLINSHYFPLTTPPLKFRIGDWVQTTANLNVREGPGLNYTIISTMPLGTIGQIVGGPVEADGYIWWDVKYVSGERGWSVEDGLTIAVPNKKPRADFGYAPLKPKAGEIVTFNASSSYDEDGEIISYQWDWNNDNDTDDYTDSPIATFWWPEAGLYEVSLTVVDDKGAINSTKKEIFIDNSAESRIILAGWGANPSWTMLHWDDHKRLVKIDDLLREGEKRLSWLPSEFSYLEEPEIVSRLNVEIDHSLAPGLTYLDYAFISVCEAELVNDAWWQSTPQYYYKAIPLLVKYGLSSIWSLLVSKEQIVSLVAKVSPLAGLVLAIGFSSMSMAAGIRDVKDLIDFARKQAYSWGLGYYFNLRDSWDHDNAWSDPVVQSFIRNSIEDGATDEQKNRILQETGEYFSNLWTKYNGDYYYDAATAHNDKGFPPELKSQIRKDIKNLIVHALEESNYVVSRKIVSVASPVELRISDSQGRITGVVEGVELEEIPNSIYDNETKTAIIFLPSDYLRYEVVGTDTGTYILKIISIQIGQIINFTAINIPTSTTAIHQYTIDWDALAQGEEGVTVQIDSDGNGVFEHTFTSDNELNYDDFMLQTATTIDIDPDVLNLKSKGKWITAYIEFPEGYNVSDIDVSSILLNGTIPVDLNAPTAIGDYDGDGVPDLMVKFNRTAVCEFILSKGIKLGNVTLTVSGKLRDGTEFEGCDTIRVRMPGDLNMDGKVDMKDIVLAARAFGEFPGRPRWNPMADENEDGIVDLRDIALIARNFGKTYE